MSDKFLQCDLANTGRHCTARTETTASSPMKKVPMGERCYTIEMTLRNFAPQEPFVVQWDYPVMVERDDMEPDLSEEEVSEDLHGVGQQMYDILKSQPLTNAEWQSRCAAANISRASFYRVRRMLLDDGYLDHDQFSKLWSIRNGSDTATPTSTGETHETARR